MIRTVKIRNFQSHKDSEVELDSGVNIVVGSSDQGKSSIFRAIGWLVENRPLSNAFKSWFADKNEEVTVEIETSEGDTIAHVRNGNSTYFLNGEELTAHGTDVPDTVKETLNFGDFNFARQFDKHFLLQESPGEVARILNRIVNLDLIDEALKKVNRLEVDCKTNLGTERKYVEVLKAEQLKYKNLPEVELLIEALENNYNAYISNTTEHFLLKDIIQKLKGVNHKISQIEQWLEVEKDSLGLFSLLSAYEKSVIERADLGELVFNLDRNHERAEALENLLEAGTTVNELLDIVKSCEILGSEINALAHLINKLSTCRTKIKLREKYLAEKIASYNKIIVENKVCPICMSPISKEKANEICKHLG